MGYVVGGEKRQEARGKSLSTSKSKRRKQTGKINSDWRVRRGCGVGGACLGRA